MARGGCAGEGVELGDELLRGHGVFRIAFGEIDPCLVSDPLRGFDRHNRRPLVGVDAVEFGISVKDDSGHEVTDGRIVDSLLGEIVQPDPAVEERRGDAIGDAELRGIGAGRFYLLEEIQRR